jgi:hypothetical protein
MEMNAPISYSGVLMLHGPIISSILIQDSQTNINETFNTIHPIIQYEKETQYKNENVFFI